jgi:hypothetical protein
MARAMTFLDLGSRHARTLAVGALLAGLTAAATVGGPNNSAAAATALWSTPAVLGTCPANEAPLVVFPSDSPTHATGPGAIAWDATSECPGGEGARVAALAGGDVPGPPAMPHTVDGRALRLLGQLAASGGPYGRIMLAGSAPASSVQPSGTSLSQGELIEGSALGPFSAPTSFFVPTGSPAPSAPVALASAYLGDVVLASPFYARDSDGIRLLVQRHHAQAFARSIAVSTGASGRIAELAVALDYRSDALAVWRQGGAIYARDLPASGRARATIQRLGPAVGPSSKIASLLSDDNRGIVAWSMQSGGETSVYIDLSAGGVRFGTPRLLERFADPTGTALPEDSPRLIRLSSESVMLAWTGSDGSNWVVRTAAIDLNGLGPVNTISPAGHDAVLAGLAPGPDGEALALWTEPQRDALGRLEPNRQAIFTARGIDAYPARTIFGEPEEVAAPGPSSDPDVALDPNGGRAVAVWRGEGGQIDYAIRTPSLP